VVVTLANAGDIDADMYVRLQIRESPTLAVRATYTTPVSVHIPARATPTSDNGTVDVPFTGVALARGSNNVCADFQLAVYT
jgi:hypothetical protein